VNRQRVTFETSKQLKIWLQSQKSKNVLTLAAVSTPRYFSFRNTTYKNRKVVECKFHMVAEARHTAGETNLATEESTGPKQVNA
jgi:hypothetical protein